jgi:hypothetical protein
VVITSDGFFPGKGEGLARTPLFPTRLHKEYSLHISSSSTRILTRPAGSLFILLLGLALMQIPSRVEALTANEILHRVVDDGIGKSARVAVTITTFKRGRKIGDKSFWFVQKNEGKTSTMLLDFVKPPESKGLRFLFIVNPERQPEAYMYLPATGKTLPLAPDNSSADIGGTGLTIDDFMAFAPRPGQKETIQGEEKVKGRECWVIRVDVPDNGGNRVLWISKKGFILLKSRQFDEKGKLKRTLRVVEFFKTKSGKEFPREEEVRVPHKKLRILVRQDSAVLNIPIPEGRLDPKTFGKFKRDMLE